MISHLSFDQVSFIKKSLGNPTGSRLIFRASEHEFKASAFHAECDNVEDTFVVVKTEFDRTIAGFTHY